MTNLTVDRKKYQATGPLSAPAVFSSKEELQKDIIEAIGEMERGELINYEEIKSLLEQYK
ncbi:hypothetical protein M2459_002359 [Parabacteroides sp. PF5-5]|uniref:hypothetical protein n=1 Tax=unclassified Parabacteroides TaxID=2649774 RepID=UPI00247323F8|nr:MULTISPECIES: hypothetical protein [unclassified Parabacteroides]MDH6305259.1 hypothetical protein [Parabacteroides sp. PH5-39]MDH6316612.1 hypothetical protein [Parabacteroides sp. PF5-13]MDH6320208.1 hypothetical protein [Parabacteroides sp. PH5-13]MDH6323849.1 hypothetical protein [Parabacteroides sp. PH5-8]MDH6327885.1 hypothetical protein [Parabacteroides sp. PH5-41]